MIGHVWGDEDSGRTFSLSAGVETVAVGWQFRRGDGETTLAVLLGPVALVWWWESEWDFPPMPCPDEVEPRDRDGAPIGPDWCYAPGGWKITNMNPGDPEKPVVTCASCGYSREPNHHHAVPHPRGIR